MKLSFKSSMITATFLTAATLALPAQAKTANGSTLSEVQVEMTTALQASSYIQYAQSSYGSGGKKSTSSAFRVKSEAELRRLSPQQRAQYERDLKAYKAAQKRKAPSRSYGS